MTTIESLAAAVGIVLRASAMPLNTEKACQAAISDALTARGMAHEREKRLSPQDVADFWFPAGVVMEIKMRRARTPDVLRQLERYAAHEVVGGIFLVTNKAMRLPRVICGKRAYYFSLGQAWL